MTCRIDQLITGAANWADFWTNLTSLPAADAGEAFERVTQLYLLSHPEYRTQLRNVWRVPGEVPPRIRDEIRLPAIDEGIDLLAKTHDGKYWAIQCKFRSDTSKPLTYRELSTFTSLAFVTCKSISLAVVVHTCAKPVRKHKYLGNTTEVGLERWLALGDEGWQAIRSRIVGKVPTLVPRAPRPHQKVAIKAAQAHFMNEARGRMIMPCATGKSLTAFWIAQALDAKTVVVAVPSLALIRQSLLDWTREYLAHGESPQWLVVCSDETTGKLERDEFVGEIYDLGIPTTTRRDEIVAFLKKRAARRIIFTTYQSSRQLAQAVKKATTKIDLAILDEAHKTVGVKSKSFATLLSDINISIRRRLFMTATERIVRGESDEVFSMDNEAVYGKRFHQLTFKEAIAKGIISDYRILTITVSDQTIRDLVAENRLIDLKGNETEAQALAAGIALKQAFHRYAIKHAISFHRSINSAKEFSQRQSLIDRSRKFPLTSLHVSSKKSAGERAELMRRFVDEHRALMTNARCLTEGVDVPAIDCVLFADPKQSVVDIVQAAGRALRPFKGKQYGYILLPLVVPSGIGINEFAETTAFKQVARTITALSTQDERIADEFRIVEHGRRASGKIVEVVGEVPVGLKLDFPSFAEQIGTKIWARVGSANWRPFEDAAEYARSLRLPNFKKWLDVWREGRIPPDIPTSPDRVYRGRGWKSWGDWLGTGFIATHNRQYRPYEEAKSFAQKLGLRHHLDWVSYCRGDRQDLPPLPADVPSNPSTVFEREWTGWGDWLGSGNKSYFNRSYWPYKTARRFARQLGLKARSDWYSYTDGKLSGKPALPAEIPAAPHLFYQGKGWISWGDWLGTGNRSNRDRRFLPYKAARAFVRKLKLKNLEEWELYSQGKLPGKGKRPENIPSNPGKFYKGKGWKNSNDWLGTNNFAPWQLKHWPFAKARRFVRSAKFNNGTEYRRYVKGSDPTRKRPPENALPAYPENVYAGEGWAGYADWLGCNPKPSPRAERRH